MASAGARAWGEDLQVHLHATGKAPQVSRSSWQDSRPSRTPQPRLRHLLVRRSESGAPVGVRQGRCNRVRQSQVRDPKRPGSAFKLINHDKSHVNTKVNGQAANTLVARGCGFQADWLSGSEEKEIQTTEKRRGFMCFWTFSTQSLELSRQNIV